MRHDLQYCKAPWCLDSLLMPGSFQQHVSEVDCPLQTVKGHAGGLKEVAFLLHDQPAWDGFCRTAAAIAGATGTLTSHHGGQEHTGCHPGEAVTVSGNETVSGNDVLCNYLTGQCCLCCICRTASVQSHGAKAATWQ